MPPLVGAPLWSSCTARAALLERREAPYFFCAPQAARVRVMCIMKELASCILELDATQVNSSSRLYTRSPMSASASRPRWPARIIRAHNYVRFPSARICLRRVVGILVGCYRPSLTFGVLSSQNDGSAPFLGSPAAVAPVPCNPGPPGPNPRAICGQPKASFFFFSHGTAFIKNKQTFA